MNLINEKYLKIIITFKIPLRQRSLYITTTDTGAKNYVPKISYIANISSKNIIINFIANVGNNFSTINNSTGQLPRYHHVLGC